jgi:hypothetical protein
LTRSKIDLYKKWPQTKIIINDLSGLADCLCALVSHSQATVRPPLLRMRELAHDPTTNGAHASEPFLGLETPLANSY